MGAVHTNPTFLVDSHGHRTHAILTYEEWELLSARPIQPDALDRKTIARLERRMADHPEEFEETPVRNPIRKARLDAGILQETLAAALKISQPALSKLEREGHHPRPSTLDRVQSVLTVLKG
jgi:ribosome-binding protein aMBF1 (putative translation factor)